MKLRHVPHLCQSSTCLCELIWELSRTDMVQWMSGSVCKHVHEVPGDKPNRHGWLQWARLGKKSAFLSAPTCSWPQDSEEESVCHDCQNGAGVYSCCTLTKFRWWWWDSVQLWWNSAASLEMQMEMLSLSSVSLGKNILLVSASCRVMVGGQVSPWCQNSDRIYAYDCPSTPPAPHPP